VKAPQLARRLTLEARTLSPDGGGGAAESWTALGIHWAEVLPRAASERVYDGVEASAVTHRIVLRGLPFGHAGRPLASQRLRDGARAYDILGVTEADARGDWLLVWAREGAA
jgi:head-tail adaptor